MGGEVAKWVKHIFRTWMAKRVAEYEEQWQAKQIVQQENVTQAGGTPRTPGKGVGLVRVPEELESLCVEHSLSSSREQRDYAPRKTLTRARSTRRNRTGSLLTRRTH